ncbi:MAG TPA: isoprenylcysteine carboxylmethyltransferase family protein [Acidobacteriota bacterium]
MAKPVEPRTLQARPSQRQEWLRRRRRIITIPFVIVAFILARYQSEFLWLSIAMVVAGEFLRIWSAGHLHKDRILATAGPYRWIRNPLYGGSFLIAVGFCIVATSMWVWLLVSIYFLFCYLPVIQYEEGLLSQKFVEAYDLYASKVPALYPTMKPYPATDNQHFSLRQVVANKEYNAVLGIIVAYLCLILLRA